MSRHANMGSGHKTHERSERTYEVSLPSPPLPSIKTLHSSTGHCDCANLLLLYFEICVLCPTFVEQPQGTIFRHLLPVLLLYCTYSRVCKWHSFFPPLPPTCFPWLLASHPLPQIVRHSKCYGPMVLSISRSIGVSYPTHVISCLYRINRLL